MMRGLAKATLELIWFAKQLLTEHNPMTLRQLHYAIFSAANKPEYDNTKADYKRLAASPLRRDGLTANMNSQAIREKS